MADKYLTLEVYPVENGWCAEGTITLPSGNKYHSKIEVHATSRPDIAMGEDAEPEREEAVKELLDTLITTIENPLLQSVLPPSIKITLRAIKGTRRLIEQKREGRKGAMAAGFNLAKIGQEIERGNDILIGAVRAQRLYGKC